MEANPALDFVVDPIPGFGGLQEFRLPVGIHCFPSTGGEDSPFPLGNFSLGPFPQFHVISISCTLTSLQAAHLHKPLIQLNQVAGLLKSPSVRPP